ncbi:hypothetical protein FNF27_08288 [Cafeteria roenbergensis]|uniref:Cathepsin propeptide inhibitor domain-containing protein n=1 Tax=Cafeteria roenbergensis TaxID=33653 RepID=A0A5A8D4T4_CAFRO|nr:hypothetical protein FNF27_08288 [Cafeteria roenbergensis]
MVLSAGLDEHAGSLDADGALASGAVRRWAASLESEDEGEEETMRFNVFRQNAAKVVAHNSKGLSWTMGLNQFADLTEEEFAAKYIGASAFHRPRHYEALAPRAVTFLLHRLSTKGARDPHQEPGPVRLLLGVLHHRLD